MKTMKSLRIGGAPAEIRIKHLLNRNLELTSLFGDQFLVLRE
jgi:hypothetical protein